MFESAEIGHKIEREEYKKRLPVLRDALLDAQYDLLQASKFPVIVLLGGINGGGKGATANILNEWFDPRHINTVAFGPPSNEENQRPPMWRFWQSLPPKGEIGILFGSWYTDPISDKSRGKIKAPC
jgi:AMP-polyphosphate phosphotransferase